MNFIEVPADRYDKYRHVFDQDHCPKAFVDSAFTHKLVPLRVNNEENPTLAYLDFTYYVIIVGILPDARLTGLSPCITQNPTVPYSFF